MRNNDSPFVYAAYRKRVESLITKRFMYLYDSSANYDDGLCFV